MTVGLTMEHVVRTLSVYITAWEQQDPDLIVTIFTERATYHERVLGDAMAGREAIRAYWESKVVGSQANIRCRLLAILGLQAPVVTAIALSRCRYRYGLRR